MSFLEAQKVLAAFEGGPPLRFLLATSGTADTLDVFVRAAAAKQGRAAEVEMLPFNTLPQRLLQPPEPGVREVFVLLPWDFVPETDWRSGFPTQVPEEGSLRERAQVAADRLARRPGARFLYLPAPSLPLFPDVPSNVSLQSWVAGLARALGAELLPPDAFSLGGYLASGTPFAGRRLGVIAEAIVRQALATAAESCKVLVTDLDNVLWHGVIGEDGLEGLHYGAEGIGYRHFLYQSLLGKLKREGVLLAAVSRNDEELATAPFRGGRMTLAAEDFVCIVASYHAKSAQIASIAERLNLGLEAFVFVDDNPVELAEVAAQLPAVRCVRFPANDDGLPELFAQLGALFSRGAVTAEDRERTEMYRRRLEGLAPSTVQGADLTAFLRELDMTLTVHDRTRGDRTRAVQLINKTNQFNLNGRRVTDEEVAAILEQGGRLYGASVSDRSGAHGEVLACLVTPDNVIRSLVLSCRVFQRRVEHAFMAWLAAREPAPRGLDFAATPRNEPMRHFLRDAAFTNDAPDGIVAFDARRFVEAHADDLELFRLLDGDGR